MPNQLIAERLLYAAEDASVTIHVKVFAPVYRPDERGRLFDWHCRVEMQGLPVGSNFSRQPSWEVESADSLGAMLLAIVSIRGALDACYLKLGLQFTWDLIGRAEGGHGVPCQLTSDLGPAHEWHLITLMMKENREFMEREPEFMARLRRAREEWAGGE